ncbi:hypothetical protein H5410_045147 [Solanum commersonii]|uniref:KHA domain-containing protein n=1 Tax=Solanum commersonii TaxID=4109 RepID=A0A9J5X8R5_SOLCO|nr:hypothetical protein H5410_045147 [Solanum commersonii]
MLTRGERIAEIEKQKVLNGRVFDPEILTEFGMSTHFDFVSLQSWDQLFEAPMPYLQGIKTKVCGVKISVNEEILGIILSVPVEGIWSIEGYKPSSEFAQQATKCGEIKLRTKRISQLLRLDRTSFFNTVKATIGDRTIIMNNLLQYLKEKIVLMITTVLVDIEHIFTSKETISVASDNGPKYSSTKIGNSRIPGRITIGCLEKADMHRKVVPFPDSIQELLDIGADKFGISLTKTN